MDDREALARMQDQMKPDHLSSVGGYSHASDRVYHPSSPSHSRTHALSPERVNGTLQPQQQHHSIPQSRALTQQQYQQLLLQQRQRRRSLPQQYQQSPRQQEELYISAPQHQRYSPRQSAIPGAAASGYQGHAAAPPKAASTAVGGMQRVPQDTSPVARSNSMYVSHVPGQGNMRPLQSHQQPPYSRFQEHGYQEQQQRQYEQYEQQSRYYRDATPLVGGSAIQDYHQKQRPVYSAPYRHATYAGTYTGPTQHRSTQSCRQPTLPKLQPQQSLNLGPINANRFPIARDQLPTAPSPPAFTATQPPPVYPEPATAAPLTTATSSTSNVVMANPTDSLPLSEATLAGNQTQDSLVDRRPNRHSGYSAYSSSPPVTAERVARPVSGVSEPSTRLGGSPMGHSTHNPSTTSLSTLARSGSDGHWSSSSSPMARHSKPKAVQGHAYSRQVTLLTIPVNEEVPPMPGKMQSKTGKIRIQLTFDRPFFNAGGDLSGRLEIQCSSSRSVMLADMVIELLGYEALTKDHLAPKIFHKSVLRLQDIRHPSQAVQENIDPDADGYWLARKGRTIFPFRMNIQDTLPNSYDSKLGQVRYVVSAITLMKANHHKEVVNHTREVFIYETWTTDDVTQARNKSVKADTSKRLFMGGEGSLEMYAELTRTMVSSGGMVYVNVGVKNLTKKKIMGIKMSLWRHIAASHSRACVSSGQSAANAAKEQDNVKNYNEIIYKGEDYAFDNDDPRVVVLPIYIPSGVYSLRNTSYLHVQFFVQVSLMASMSKALAVELPIYITHASSWSDPPPRIPRDFAFPMHEDDPVKKNKTGVFSKKKSSSIIAHSNGSNGSSTNLKKLVIPNGPASANASVSAPTSMTGTPEITDSTRPVTQRSALKDPDSPTSVLDFSQAGNLFVVNPDTSGIKAVSDSSILVKQPLATRSTPTPRVLSATSDTIPTPSTTSSSLDRPTSLTLSEQVTPRLPEGEAEDERPVEDKVMDFDMSRSANASQPNPVKKDHERSKSRMGLRRTLAKLSIAIPTHGPVSSPGLAKTSHRSPCAQSTTPHSAKSLGMASNDDVESPDSGSSGGPLSRQSSGSSFGSPKNALDSRSRRSSAGSTRIMTVSPGPSSPNVGYLRMTSIPGSGPGSAVPSAANSATPSATPSRASSPTMLSDSSASVGAQDDQSNRERHHGVSRLSTTPTKPDIRLHVGTPVTEEMRHKGYYQPDDSDSRPSTPSPLANMESTTHSSPTTPNSFIQPWAVGRKYSNASVASSSLDPLERGQTAQGIRDEFYLNKDVQDQNMPTESFETRMVELQTGIPTSSGSAQCSVIKPFYEEPVVAGRFAGQMTQGSEQAVCNAVNQHKVQEYSMAPPAMETHPPHTVSTPPPAALLSPSASGILMAPRQSPESFYDGDEYPLPFQSAGFSPAQWFHESRSSSSHSFHSHPGVEANTPSQAPFEARARSISPHVKTSISRSTSQGSAVALTDSNLELPAQEFSPQNLEGARIQGAMSMKPTVEQFPSEIYSTSGSVPDNSRRHGTPHPMIPLLSSNSFPSDQRWLTLNDADVSNQLGAQGSGTLIEQPLDMHSTNAEVYGDAPGYHESDYYPGCASAPSSEHTSSHPSRSNSRRSSPKRHWHSDPTTPIVQQPMMAQESGHYDVTANGKHCQQNRTMTMTTDIPQRQVQSKVYPTDAGAYPSREAMQSVHKRDARQQALSQQNSHGRGVMNGGSALETMSKGEHEEEIGEPGSTRGNRAVLSVVNLEHDQNQGEAQ